MNPKNHENNKRKAGVRMAAFFAAIVLAAFFISRYFFQLMLIRGDSMQPSYRNMQLTVLDKWHREYSYGDVIAFRCEGLKGVLVKRIAAIPGDAVQIREGTLYVNGEISEVYSESGIFEYAGIAAKEIVLAPGQFFVIGDNIAESKDSRYEAVGMVDEAAVVGKVAQMDAKSFQNGRKY